ncbi:Hint domain-containing protein [Dysgonomonas sp. BGC7]|uniref:Hint domain-containing protein n=1 Tax=Dysgonomonas sp. BGC7 TaxID=1658008 RepID=UPI00068359F4|nr:Hint domain-containing protein [Dysgonomonas sp. BGC7]MBD8389997.1 hypothetical protein [Dysgonomonas sp. BGC7]
MKIKTFFFALVCLFILSLSMNAQSSLAAGTRITMADDSKKNIEKIIAGDKILVFNIKDKVYEEKKVKGIKNVMQNRLIRITLETGANITGTIENPIYAEKGWASVDPNRTRTNEKYGNTQRLNIGEFVLYYNTTTTDYVEVSVIQGILDPVQTFNIELEDSSEGAFIANGFLVGIN